MLVRMDAGRMLQGISQHTFQRPQPPKNFFVAREQCADLTVETSVNTSERRGVGIGVRPRDRVPRQRVDVAIHHEVGPREESLTSPIGIGTERRVLEQSNTIAITDHHP